MGKVLKWRQVLKMLRKNGFYPDPAYKKTGGSHEVWVNPETGRNLFHKVAKLRPPCCFPAAFFIFLVGLCTRILRRFQLGRRLKSSLPLLFVADEFFTGVSTNRGGY